MTGPVTSIDGRAPGTGVRRLPFLDGVRGFAALVVLCGHLVFAVPTLHQPSLRHAGIGDLLVWPFRFGHEMVYLFLVVSGFSLHYSEVVRRARGRAPSTLRQFAARRAWRIAPIYYVAVGLGLAATPLLSTYPTAPGAISPSHVTVGGLLSHLAFVHNLRGIWSTQINGPLWSIAYEVQIYLLFPALFWAVRRWNPWLVCGFIAAVDVVTVTKGGLGFPVFGLVRWFALGLLLAELTVRGVRVAARISLPIGIGALLVGMAQLPGVGLHITKHDPIWAVAFAGLLFAMIDRSDSTWNPFTSRPLRWLGLRSYSLYALHWPVVMLLIVASIKLGLTGWSAVGFVASTGLIAALAITVLAFRYVEGPSLERVARVGRPSEPAVS